MPNSHHSFNGSSTSSHKVPVPYAMHVALLCIKYLSLTQRKLFLFTKKHIQLSAWSTFSLKAHTLIQRISHLQSLIVPMRTPRFILAMQLNLVHKLFNISQCFNHRWWSWHMSFCHLIKCFMRGTF